MLHDFDNELLYISKSINYVIVNYVEAFYDNYYFCVYNTIKNVNYTITVIGH